MENHWDRQTHIPKCITPVPCSGKADNFSTRKFLPLHSLYWLCFVQDNKGISSIESHEFSVTSKKSPNVYKSGTKTIFLVMEKILTPLQKLTKMCWQFGQNNFSLGFEKLSKGHTYYSWRNTYAGLCRKVLTVRRGTTVTPRIAEDRPQVLVLREARAEASKMNKLIGRYQRDLFCCHTYFFVTQIIVTFWCIIWGTKWVQNTTNLHLLYR